MICPSGWVVGATCRSLNLHVKSCSAILSILHNKVRYTRVYDPYVRPVLRFCGSCVPDIKVPKINELDMVTT